MNSQVIRLARGPPTGRAEALSMSVSPVVAPQPCGAKKRTRGTTMTNHNDQHIDSTDLTGADAANQESRPEREAARYRRALRDAEAERDQLRKELDEARRAIHMHIAGDMFAVNGDNRLVAWLKKPEDLDSLTDIDPTESDPAKIRATLTQLFKTRRELFHWFDPLVEGSAAIAKTVRVGIYSPFNPEGLKPPENIQPLGYRPPPTSWGDVLPSR